MAQWIMHRPPKHSHEAEIRVAEQLKKLDGRWTVIWGYFYQDRGGNDREGDFLVIGPAGGVMVLEVKSRVPRHFSATGQWEGEQGSPVDQLMMEWGGVRRRLQDMGCGLWITKALCCPGEDASVGLAEYQGIPRQMLVLGNDLADWLPTWLRLFDQKVRNPVMPEDCRMVVEAFGGGAGAASRHAFIDHTEHLFQSQLARDFGLLDQLDGNRQLLVSGGTGTGKTWHALEQCYRYAEEGEGKQVLLLVYNIALANQLERLVAMRRLEKGRVRVMGWETLFRSLVDLGGGTIPPLGPDAGFEETQVFYERNLPGVVLELARDPERRHRWPQFDALVVDEGQDHDTAFDPEIPGGEEVEGGWWHIYRLLLAEGAESRVSVFFDRAQRPPFRKEERFEPMKIAALFSQPAWLRISPAVRYTRNLWAFLTEHRADAITGMIDALGEGHHLPEGPELEVHTVEEGSGAVSDAVKSIITRWAEDGLCRPAEVLILHRRSTIADSPLGGLRVLGVWNVRDCQEEDIPADAIRHSSINKAKGLDAKAVIVVGLRPFEEITDAFEHYNWFMATSRARQLLAMVHVGGEGSDDHGEGGTIIGD